MAAGTGKHVRPGQPRIEKVHFPQSFFLTRVRIGLGIRNIRRTNETRLERLAVYRRFLGLAAALCRLGAGKQDPEEPKYRSRQRHPSSPNGLGCESLDHWVCITHAVGIKGGDIGNTTTSCTCSSGTHAIGFAKVSNAECKITFCSGFDHFVSSFAQIFFLAYTSR